jgi:hypothetical protein
MSIPSVELLHMEHGKRGGGFRILMIDDNTAITPHEEAFFIHLWENGRPFWDICKAMGRSEKELTVLAFELAEEGKIKPRKGGVLGVTN